MTTHDKAPLSGAPVLLTSTPTPIASREALAAQLPQERASNDNGGALHAQRLPGMPEGFYLNGNRIHRRISRKNGDVIDDVPICGRLEVQMLASRLDGSCWTRIIKGINRLGRERTWHVLEVELVTSPKAVMAQLLDDGFWIAPGREAQTGVIDLISGWQCDTRVFLTENAGWVETQNPVFALPSGQILGASNVIASPSQTTAVPGVGASSGTLDSWKTNIAARCSGNPLAMLAVCTAFAGPLLKHAGVESGGVHLRGNSSCGKTTLLHAASSVWGGSSVRQSWRTTANALEATAAIHSDMMLGLDELGEISPLQLDESIYLLGNGKGKARMTAKGARRAMHHWRVMLLSTGEISVAEHLAEANKRHRAGQEMRLLDFEADARRHGVFDDLQGFPDGGALADALKAASAETYGIAGPLFVRKLIDDADWLVRDLTNDLADRQAHLLSLAGKHADGLARRAARRLALIMLAGEKASAFGLTGWTITEVKQAIGAMYRAWLESSAAPCASVVDAALDRIRQFVTANPHRFTVIENGIGRPATGIRAGWIYEGRILISPVAWRRLHDPADAVEVARALKRSGHLLAGEGDNLARKLPSRLGTGRHYSFSHEAIFPPTPDTMGGPT